MEEEITVNERPFKPKSPRFATRVERTASQAEEKEKGELVVVICTLDGSRREVKLDLCMNAVEAALQVGKEFDVRLKEEYGLAFPEKRGWLDEARSLYSLGIKEKNELIYKKKFFIADEELSRKDESDILLLYPQSVDGFVRGYFRCSAGQAVGLGALQARVHQAEQEEKLAGGVERASKRSSADNLPSVSEMAEMLPPDSRSGASVKCVIDQVESMGLMSAMDAKFQFVHICSSLDGYGITAYVVGDTWSRLEAPGIAEKSPVLLGVGRSGIFRINYKTNEIMESYSFGKLAGWACGKSTFVLDFGEHRASHWGVLTSSPKALAQIISGYIRLLKTRTKA